MTATASRTTGIRHDLRVFDSLLDAVGNTPLVRLHTLTDRADVEIWAKLEYLNPGGSTKDRAAASMILDAEARGALRRNGTVVEATSGNTGIGLAQFAATRGYRVVVVAPDKTSAEKITLLKAYGAEVVVLPSGLPADHPGYVRNYAQRLAASIPGGWFAGQYDNPANPAAHEQTTGPEIWNQTSGRVTHLVAGIGTGGTITGTGRFLKNQGTVTIVGAEPAGSNYSLPPSASPHADEEQHAWYVEAVGHFRHPETQVDDWPSSYDPALVDSIVVIDDATAIARVRDLAVREGILAGGSSGVALSAAARIAAEAPPEAVIVVVLPDSGRSYLSKYYSPEWLTQWGFDARPSPSSEPEELPHVAAQTTVADALSRWPAGHESALVTLRDARAVVASEVIGSINRSELLSAPADSRVDDHAHPPLVAGARERLSTALARWAPLVPSDDDLVTISDQGFATHVLSFHAYSSATNEKNGLLHERHA